MNLANSAYTRRFQYGVLLPLVYYLDTPWTNQFLGYTENGKQLQVTTIKLIESKENKSIRRLDLPGSTGPGGGGGWGAGTLAAYGSVALFNIAAYTKITQIKELVNHS